MNKPDNRCYTEKKINDKNKWETFLVYGKK